MRRIASCILTIFMIKFVVASSNTEEDSIVVETHVGTIKGWRASDGNYTRFLGIPYAIVDKDNPFGPSTPQPKFDTIFDAIDESAICPQYDATAKKAVGTIDCLHMNIFVPNTANSQNRVPVFVWIYGGNFKIGNYQTKKLAPQFLMKHNFIFVTFNYRVGPYGFMCLDTPEVSGNAGLKDQLIALKWVKNTIASFGGDADQITLGGQSAGSASVDFHLLFDKETYFHRAIMNSGTSQCPWAIKDSDRNEPIYLAKLLGYNASDYIDAMSFLSKTEPTLVIEAKINLNTQSRPCVEKKFDNVEQFITDYPVNVKIPRAKTTPILIGFNYDEMLVEYMAYSDSIYNDSNLFSVELAMAFDLNNRAEEMREIVKHFYIGDDNALESKSKFINFASDILFNHPIERAINRHLETEAAVVFHYMFTYVGGRNSKFARNVTIGGAAHGDELPYIFDIESFKNVMSSDDKIIVDRMTTLYANFVKYGNPTPVITDVLPVKWFPVINGTRNYLNINLDIKMDNQPHHERLAFWDLFYTANKKAQIGYCED